MNYTQDLFFTVNNCLLASLIYYANYPGLEKYSCPGHFLTLKERFERTGNVHYEKNRESS